MRPTHCSAGRAFGIGRITLGLLAACAATIPTTSSAGGYLWLGAEYAGEGTVYRYDIAANAINYFASPARPSGGEHWNNCATDGTNLYLGVPNQGYLGIADQYTGVIHTPTAYSQALAGRFEDGAFRVSSGTLWRVTYNSTLHETTTGGTWLNSWAVPSSLVGLEWVGSTLYATKWSAADGSFGRIDFVGATATFVPIPWRPGFAPTGRLAALAFDAQDAKLYLIADDRTLYTVAVSDMAEATLVVDLVTLGYPASALVDGMGWVAAPSTGVLPEQTTKRAYWLSEPRPNPAAELVRFDVRAQAGSAATLTVVDLRGRLLRRLSSGLPAGDSQLVWDFRDDHGRRVPAGTYFVRLDGADGVVARKVVRTP